MGIETQIAWNAFVKLAPHTFAIFTFDIDMQSARGALIYSPYSRALVALLFGDSTGRAISRAALECSSA